MLGVVLAVPIDDAPTGAVEPSTRVAGLTLALRGVLTLQHAGVQRVLLVVRAAHRELVDQIRADPRTRLELTAVVLEPDESPWAALRGEVTESFVLARHDCVADPAIYRRLLQAPLGGALGLLAGREGEPVGPLLGTERLIDALGSGTGAEPLTAAVQRGEVGLLDVGTAWTADVRTTQGQQQAVFHLFEACRKPVDGLISRHLNRHVSIFISKRLVNTSLTPNQATLGTFLVALMAAALATQGGYGWTLASAALMQVNSILDGVDGELARVRFQQSKLGQWLDTIGDDASNALFYAALAIGARQLPWGAWLTVSGWVAAAAAVLTAVVYYGELLRAGSGDLYTIEWDFDRQRPAGLWGKIVLGFRYFLKQDFFIFTFLCVAVVGLLSYILPLIALGAIITLVAATGRSLRLWGTANRGVKGNRGGDK